MSEATVVQEIERELIESGKFRYEPQYPSEIAQAIHQAELHRVNGMLRGQFDIDYPGDTFLIIAEKPRKITDQTVLADYGARHAWWLRFSPEFHGQLAVNPFEQEQSETQVVVQDGKAVAALYNFGAELDDASRETIMGAYDWFSNFTHGQFKAVERMIVTDSLVLAKEAQEDEALKIGQTIGLHYPFLPGTVLFDETIFDSLKDRDNYKALLAGGVSFADLVVTHEFAHALTTKKVLKAFADATDWQTRQYAWGKRRNRQSWEITGQGSLLPALPPTPLGDLNSSEDLAETITTYRFKPEFLDDVRYNFMANLSQSYALNWYEDPQPAAVSMERTSQPIYPYHTVPAKIGARVLTEAQLERLCYYDSLAEKLSEAVNILGILKRHFAVLDRLDEARW